MLGQRVITAIVMFTVLLCFLFLFPEVYFIGLILFLSLIAGAEWSRLQKPSSQFLQYAYGISVLLLSYLAWQLPTNSLKLFLIAAMVLWTLSLILIIIYPRFSLVWNSRLFHHLAGYLVLVPAFSAMMMLRMESQGSTLILYCLLLVAAADTGAYFSGRSLGRTRLAPRVSPNKTWEGLAGGMLLAVLLGLLGARYLLSDPVPGAQFLRGKIILMSLAVAVFSVIGDLLESMVKRHCQVKDSGNILPGHGGLLDRIDGISAAAPVFTLFYLMADSWGPV